MLKVSSHHNRDPKYLEARNEYVKKCMNNNNIIFLNEDWLSHHKDIHDNKKRQVFKYCDEYCHERYYTVNTYETQYPQACSYKPYESLGFWSTEDGIPLCEDGDPFNNGDINNTGTNLCETHYASYFDLRDACHYYWDKE